MKTFVSAVAAILLPTAALAQTSSVDPLATTGAIPGTGSTGLSTVAPGSATGSATNPGQLDFGTGSSGGATGVGGAATGSAANAGQLDVGIGSSGGATGVGGAVTGSAANAGQLDLGRTPSGGMSSGGAAIGSGTAGVPGTDDIYTQPIYGGR